MLSLTVVERRRPSFSARALDGARRCDPRGFRDSAMGWQELSDYQEGTCSQGGDFFCETRGGIFSCMPCDRPQLASFKSLQIAVNAVLESRGLSARIERGPLAKSAIDGRIGPSTTAALGALAAAIQGDVPARGLAADALSIVAASPTSEAAMRAVAGASAEIFAWLGEVTRYLSEPPPTPVPPSQVTPADVTAAQSPKSSRRIFAVVALGVASLAAIGLVGTAALQKRGL